jgi:hypothetical protein
MACANADTHVDNTKYTVPSLYSLLQLTGIHDGDLAFGGPRRRSLRLYGVHDGSSLQYLAKHHVAAIQPRRFHGGNEELRPIRAWAGIGHGQVHGSLVLDFEALVFKLIAVNGFAFPRKREIKREISINTMSKTIAPYKSNPGGFLATHLLVR